MCVVIEESFKAAFPGLRKYISEQIDTCRVKGYVETIRKRRRLLPNITSIDTKLRAQVHILSKCFFSFVIYNSTHEFKTVCAFFIGRASGHQHSGARFGLGYCQERNGKDRQKLSTSIPIPSSAIVSRKSCSPASRRTHLRCGQAICARSSANNTRVYGRLCSVRSQT